MTKNKTRSDEDLTQICQGILSNKKHKCALPFSLSEIQRFYSILVQNLDNQSPVTSIVNLGYSVSIQFSNISPQRFLITKPVNLTEDHFAFIPNRKWYGIKNKPDSFLRFFFDELCKTNWYLIPFFFLSSAIIFLIQDYEIYEIISGLVLQATTVFLSIFLIFTVSQNKNLFTDKSLFEQGITTKFFTDDRNLVILAIISIVLSISTVILSQLFSKFTFEFTIKTININQHIILSMITGLTITFMLDSFLSIINYYVSRSRTVIERDLISSILDEDYQRYKEKE